MSDLGLGWGGEDLGDHIFGAEDLGMAVQKVGPELRAFLHHLTVPRS